ncbi:MAG: electron transport complex subunit RsxC [Polyangiaceae bacterium]|nr:electron transport complex subunit RsxC [Polyangiaceae bacterium]
MLESPVTAPGRGTFTRGIHPFEGKELAADAPIEVLPTPKQLLLPVLQHIGAPAKPPPKLDKDAVAGKEIAGPGGFVSAPVHASVTGKVGKIVRVTLPNGRHVDAVAITPDPEQPTPDELYAAVLGGDWPATDLPEHEPGAIADAVKRAGIVGMGGAAFPTHVKLASNPAKPVDVVLVNGCECEPYLTADYRVMLEAPRGIVAGALLAARAAGAKAVVVAVETNKPRAIEALRTAARGTIATVKELETKYPMGGEKQTVPAALGRTIPTGGLPLDVGVVVINVGTALAIARAVLREQPVTHRVVTVTGHGVHAPKNLLVPIGAPYADLVAAAGGLRKDAVRVVSGGPMMGFAVADLSVPVTKGTSGITVLTRSDLAVAEQTACVRCGRCVDVCPLGLVPTKLALAARKSIWDVARRYHITACMECGCCAYTCPASIPLVQLIRMGKARLPRG